MALSYAQAFVTNSQVFALGHPFFSPAPLMQHGAMLGFYLGSARPFYLDPAQLMKHGAHSLVVVVYGEKNSGKSTLLKDSTAKFCALQAGLGQQVGQYPSMRVRITDRKPNQHDENNGQVLRGEFAALTDYLLADSVSLASIGQINPYDMRMAVDETTLIETAYITTESVLERRLENYESAALEIAARRMLEKKHFSIDALRTYLATPEEADVVAHYTNTDFVGDDSRVAIVDDPRLYSKFREDSIRLAGAQASLVTGAFGGVFGGTNSLYDILSSDIVNIDWTGVSGKPGDLLETLFYKWDATALRLRLPLNADLSVSDEEGTRIKNPVHAAAFAQYVREARAYRKISILATQFSTDFDNLGESGSSIRGLGREIDSGIGVRIYGRQPNKPEIIESITRHGINRSDALATTLLPQGCWAIKLPDRPIQFFQHDVDPSMLPVYETNRAMKQLSERYIVDEVPHVKERIAKISALWPSVMLQLRADPSSYGDVRDGFLGQIGEEVNYAGSDS